MSLLSPLSLAMLDGQGPTLIVKYETLDIPAETSTATAVVMNKAFVDVMIKGPMMDLPTTDNYEELAGQVNVLEMVTKAASYFPEEDRVSFLQAVMHCVDNINETAQFQSLGIRYTTRVNVVEENGTIFGIWTFEAETLDNLKTVMTDLLSAQAPTLLLRFPDGKAGSIDAKVVLINEDFGQLFLNGVTDGLPTPKDYEEVGEVEVESIRQSSKFLFPNEDWDSFASQTREMYKEVKASSAIWKFRSEVWKQSLTYFNDINGDLLGMWVFTVADKEALATDPKYIQARSEILRERAITDKPFSLYLPIKDERGNVVDLECMWQNQAWEIAAPNQKYASTERLSLVATERLPMFLKLSNEVEQKGKASMTIERRDAEGSVTIESSISGDGIFHLVSFTQQGLFSQLLDQSNPTFIIKINPAEFGTERVILVNKTYEESFFPLGMPKHFPRTTSFGTTDISMEEFMAELESEDSGGDKFKDANQAFNEQVLNHVLENGYEGKISGYVSNPLGAFERTATFTKMDNGTVFLTIAFEPVTDDIIMTAPEFAQKRIELLGEQVMDLTKAIAAHKPVFDDQGNLVDLEFLWANQEFNRWRRTNIQTGMMNSQERIRFDELLPYFQRAMEEGQASQFFTLNPDDSTNSIYDYAGLFEDQEGQVSQIEVETLFSRTPEGYIIEWGDDINAKIQHGSEIELQRKRVENLEKEKVQQRERDHFISEIHDNTLQELFVIGMGLQPFLKEGGPTPTEENIHDFSRAIDRIAKDLRALITNEMELRDSFDTQLQVLAERYNRISTFTVVFLNTSSADGKIERIPQNLCDDLFKATQEAVTNAVKHSGGDEITIQLTMKSNNIILMIDDNGIGIEDISIRKSGTRNMAQRIEKHQGDFSIQKLPEHGTRVSFRVDNISLIKI